MHLWSIHHTWALEEFCYQSYTSSITNSQLRDKLNETITNTGWDLTGAGRIDNMPTSSNCDSYPTGGSWIGMVYVAQDSTPCGGEFSCVYFLQPRYINGTMVDYWQSLIYLATTHVTGTNSFMHAVISHETGHVFGLQDPPAPPATNCTGGGWWFGSSVMHQFGYYGCPAGDIQYPTIYDKDTVVNGEMPIHY